MARLPRPAMKCFAYSFRIFLDQRTAWLPLLSEDISYLFQTLVLTHHRSVNRCCLVWGHLIKLASTTGVGFQLCHTQNAIHFLRHEEHLFN